MNKINKPYVNYRVLILILFPIMAFAQFNGHNTRGDYGLSSGTQPPPGIYIVAPMYILYIADEFHDKNGNTVLIDNNDKLTVNAFVAGFIYVSEHKIFGGNYSFQVYPAISNSRVEIPLFSLDEKSSTGFSDLYMQPINLGWHNKKADFTAGLGLYIPTGKYEFGGDGNIGLGMWSFEIFAGATLYFDDAKTWHFATTAFYETHTNKKDTNIKVGDVLTLEGGLGWSFLEGAASVGVSYFAQWKTSHDDLGIGDLNIDESLIEIGLGDLVGVPIDKNRVFGIGPQLSIPVPIKDKLVAFIDARYLWDIGARSALQGNTFVINLTFPIPSISLEEPSEEEEK